jgi:hypothetical protein
MQQDEQQRIGLVPRVKTMQLPPFLDRLVDWQDFERFVRDMYAQDGDLVVEHNVEERGKSGSLRQTDVKFTHRAANMTYTTLVECKKWKKKVTRDRVDVLAASVEDLGANKGVMFTTTGYEPGAEAYAHQKGIELFIVRDLLDDEWGAPGRHVSFWMHLYAASFGRLNFEAKLLSIGPAPVAPQLNLGFRPDGQLDDQLTLVSPTGSERGPNLMTVLAEARQRVLKLVSDGVTGLIGNGQDADELTLRVPVIIDFTQAPMRSLVVTDGRFDIEAVKGELLVKISQTQFSHDRGQGLDLALAVEHFMTRQRQVVIRSKEGEVLQVYSVPDQAEHADADADADDVMTPNTLLRIFTEAWVDVGEVKATAPSGNLVRFDLPDWTTTVTEPS